MTVAQSAWDSSRHRVVIVGAGVAGLSAFIALRKRGFDPLVLEKRLVCGGIWSRELHLAAYDPLVQNTSRGTMTFPNVPDRSHSDALYFTRHEYAGYFEEAINRHTMQDRVWLGVAVRSYLYDASDDVVRVRASDLSCGSEFCILCDHLVLASGTCNAKFEPDVPGLANFRKPVLHSSSYFEPTGNETVGDTPLVVGLGNTGADLAVDVAKKGKRVSVSVRNDTWVVPRHTGKAPFDKVFSELKRATGPMLPRALYETLSKTSILHIGKNGSWSETIDYRQSRIIINDEFPRFVERGAIEVRPAIRECDASGVAFSDGTSLCPSSIVLCTGFSGNSPKCENATSASELLIHNVVSVKSPRVFFVAAPALLGSLVITAQLQGRLVARCIAEGTIHFRDIPNFERIGAPAPEGWSLVEFNDYSDYLMNIVGEYDS